MRGKEPVEHATNVAALPERVRDKEVRRGVVRTLHLSAVPCYLLERARKPIRVARQKRTGRIREELPLARDGELNEHADDRREYDEHDTNERESSAGVAVTSATASVE